MKRIFFYIMLLSLLSCDSVEDSRPATVVGTTISGGGGGSPSTAPSYIAPYCSPNNLQTTSSYLNFKLTFSSSISSTYSGGVMTVVRNNSNNDKVTISLAPFVAKQSTVYKIKNTASNLSNYSAYISFAANSMDPYTKLNANSTGTDAKYVHVRYVSSTDSYEMIFCDVEHKFSQNFKDYFALISGKFTFKY